MSDLPESLPTPQSTETTPIPTTTEPPTTEPLLAPAPVETAPVVAFVPFTQETFTKALPDGFTYDESALALVNKLQIGEPALKELLTYQMTATQQAAKATAEAWAAQNEEWKTQVKSNAEFGGAKLPETLARANQIVEQFGGKEMFAMLSMTGAGNHPAMIGFLAKLASALPSEPRAPTNGRPFTSERSQADRLFTVPIGDNTQ